MVRKTHKKHHSVKHKAVKKHYAHVSSSDEIEKKMKKIGYEIVYKGPVPIEGCDIETMIIAKKAIQDENS